MRLVRYLVRPPLAAERLTESTGGQLVYHFRRPWSDGSTALLLAPLELLERLAALVPPPRRPLLAYHGLLAPHARWRAAVVPPPRADTRMATVPGPRRWSWAQLLRRVFGFDVLVCDRCGGPRRILGAVTEPHAVRRSWGRSGSLPSRRRVPAAPPDAFTARPCRRPRARLRPDRAGAGSGSPASASGGLPQALACRLDRVVAWARPAGGAGRGDETQGSGARKVVCVSFYEVADPVKFLLSFLRLLWCRWWSRISRGSSSFYSRSSWRATLAGA